MALASPQAQATATAAGAHLVLYDGVCGLCNHLLQFLFRHDRRGAFCFASLQSATGRAMLARYGGNPDEPDSFHVVADFQAPSARAIRKSDAAVFVASQLGWPWRGLRVAGRLPTPFRDFLYDVVARNRYRIFGRYEQCLVPSDEMRSRFVD
jgi:predicted DCC family thiol-disulfide oxidoreductase YuxK